MAKGKLKTTPTNTIVGIEKILLGLIALLTIIIRQELLTIIEARKVDQQTVIVIYTEVLGMIGVFYASNRIIITLPCLLL